MPNKLLTSKEVAKDIKTRAKRTRLRKPITIEKINPMVFDWPPVELIEGKPLRIKLPDDFRVKSTDPSRFSPELWEALLSETEETIRGLAKSKGGEYSGDEDRLLNFRRNAQDTGASKELIWRIYAAKHWDAIGQYIRDLGQGKKRQRTEPLSGRCDDLIVYLILFKAMLIENGDY